MRRENFLFYLLYVKCETSILMITKVLKIFSAESLSGKSWDFPSYYGVLRYSDTGVGGRYNCPWAIQDYGVPRYCDTGVDGRYTVPGQSRDFPNNYYVLGYCDMGQMGGTLSLDNPRTFPSYWDTVTQGWLGGTLSLDNHGTFNEMLICHGLENPRKTLVT